MRTGTANLPLHWHHCPRWLFDRMVKLSAAIIEAIVEESFHHILENALRRAKTGTWRM